MAYQFNNNSIVKEHKKYNQRLHQLTLFPKETSFQFKDMERIIVSFRFRTISFSKKRALIFFLALELITHRKCVASLSSRNIQA